MRNYKFPMKREICQHAAILELTPKSTKTRKVHNITLPWKMYELELITR